MSYKEKDITEFVKARFEENEPIKVVCKKGEEKRRYVIETDSDVHFTQKDGEVNLPAGAWIDVTDWDKRIYGLVYGRGLRWDYNVVDVTDSNNFLFGRNGFKFIEMSDDKKFVLRQKEDGNQYSTHAVGRDFATSQGHYFYYGKWNGYSSESAYNAAKYDLLQREMDEIYKSMNPIQRQTTRYAGDLAYAEHLNEEKTALKIFGASLVQNLIAPYGERNENGCELVKSIFDNLIENNMYTEEWKNMCMELLDIDDILSEEEQELY